MEKHNNPELTKNLELIFTIDGYGRPKKCQKFLELVKKDGIVEIMKEIEKMAQRKFV